MEKVPDYVLDLLEAFLLQKPLDFKTHEVPAPVQRILKLAKEDGLLKGVKHESIDSL